MSAREIHQGETHSADILASIEEEVDLLWGGKVSRNQQQGKANNFVHIEGNDYPVPSAQAAQQLLTWAQTTLVVLAGQPINAHIAR